MNEFGIQIRWEMWSAIQIPSFNEEVPLYSSHELLLMYILMMGSCLQSFKTLFKCLEK